MTSKAETAITDSIIAWIKSNGGDAFHVHGTMFQRSGEPDICGELRCHIRTLRTPEFAHIKWEVKTFAKNSKPSKLQIYRLDKYCNMGYCIGVVRSVEEAEALLKEFEENGNNKRSWYDGYGKKNAAMARTDTPS